MTLGELIAYLETKDQDYIVPLGFNSPHSYRGNYEDLAFEPCANRTVGEMLACAKEALGTKYTGWKGGYYRMHEDTTVWLSRFGESSKESIGPHLLRYMLGEYN